MSSAVCVNLDSQMNLRQGDASQLKLTETQCGHWGCVREVYASAKDARERRLMSV